MAALSEAPVPGGLGGAGLVASDLPGRGADRPAAERGDLSVADRAVQHVIEHVTRTVPGTVVHDPTLRRLVGTAYPHAKVRVEGRRALVALDVAVGWPSSLTQVAASVREAVATEGSRLTGLSIGVVDVTVHVVDTPTTTRRVQ